MRATIRQLRSGDPLPEGEPRRFRNQQGYIRLRWLVSPNQYVEVYEHRLNAGMPAPWLHVHHLNGDKADNRPENLRVLSATEHATLHADSTRGQGSFAPFHSAAAKAKAERRIERERAKRQRVAAMVDMYRAGKSTTQIATELGIHHSNVSRHLRAAGVVTRAGAQDRRRGEDHELTLAKALVHARSGMSCERCGRSVKWDGGEVHHRKGRGGPNPHDPTNLVHLCRDCHGHVHSHPEQSYDTGWMIRRGGAEDPAVVPILDLMGWRWLLTDRELVAA